MKEHIAKYSGIYILLALVAGVFIGKSSWVRNSFSQLLNYVSNNNNTTTSVEGSICTTTDGKSGKITGGICTVVGDVPVDANIQRTSSIGFPNKIVIPVSSRCQLYTATNPYKHTDGCSYKFDTYVYQSGVVRYCSLVKISCP